MNCSNKTLYSDSGEGKEEGGEERGREGGEGGEGKGREGGEGGEGKGRRGRKEGRSTTVSCMFSLLALQAMLQEL